MSDEEKDMQNEINLDIDGNVKVSKVHRGYEEDVQDDGEEKQEKDNESVSSMEKPKDTRKRAESNNSGIEKYTKPLRETHSKYL